VLGDLIADRVWMTLSFGLGHLNVCRIKILSGNEDGHWFFVEFGLT
jgi:hypothetical protein